MPYYVETVPSVIEYLNSVEGLSEAGRLTVVDGYIRELAEHADRFLTLYPLGPESLHFRYDYPLIEGLTLFDFDFVVDASHLESSVVRVVYVEYTSKPLT